MATFEKLYAAIPDIPIVVLTGEYDEAIGPSTVAKGAQDYLVKQGANSAELVRVLRYSLARHRAQQEKLNELHLRKSGRVIGFLGAKGGVGATTIALNVATALAMQGKKVILVEMHSTFGMLAFHLHQDPARSLQTLLDLPPERIGHHELNAVICQGPTGLWVLFGPKEGEDYKEISPQHAEAIIKGLSDIAEFVIVDLPSQPSAATQAVAGLCHFAAVVSEREPGSVMSGKVAVKLLHKWGTHVMAEARELLGRRKDGSEFPVDIGVAPVRTTEGLFVLGEIADTTVRKQLEAKTLRIKEIEVQEAERRHLARELHDEIGQLLSAISIDLHTVKETFGSVASRLDDSISLVDQAIEHVRSLALDLRPSMLDDLGLIATLRWYTDRHALRAGLALHLITESSGARLPADLATACYRVIQEALTNVIRHANAHQVWIEFHDNQGEVRLSVRDDGIGFNLAVVQQRQAGTACFGVLGMQERVELLGGRIDIRSHPVSGTTVEVWIPQATAEKRQRSIGSHRE